MPLVIDTDPKTMTNLKLGLLAVMCLAVVVSCKWMQPASNTPAADPKTSASPTPTPTPIGDIRGTTSKSAFHIEGNIDEAHQEGDVCDTSVEFKVPGTLEFKFTPTDAMKGTYTYSGPFKASGSGPYEIHDDGSMLVDGTGCIMGKCATYSHKWKATKIDPAACKGK
jgi:hypothetical protein